MAVDQRLNIKQSQTMAMTPQMQQSIKILQLSVADLVSYIDQELEQNPFLERSEGDDSSGADDSPQEQEKALADGVEERLVDRTEGDSWSDDTVSGAVYESDDGNLNYSGAKGGNGDFGDADYNFEQVSAAQVTLRDHILDQVNVDIHDATQRIIAVHVADMLDDSGYIAGDLDELATRLQCKVEDVEAVVAVLQTFDPAGVFARNLGECLALQLQDKNRYDPAMEVLVQNLDLMAACEFKKLQKLCGVSSEDLMEMCQEIKELNPKPGSDFSPDVVEAIQPDVFLRKSGKAGWHLELNSEALPRVLVNRRYYSQIEPKTRDEKSKKFMSEQLSTANWLAKALDQRANTILKVATEIVSQQDAFFRKGVRFLKPMILSDISEAIEMHESTVSRVINGKFLATHMGLYELKYFFSSHVGSTEGDGEDVSSKAVKYLIKELIDKENPDQILSDGKIANVLKGQGINVARRTVMKYREAMRIGSSVQRRKQKKLALKQPQ